MNKIQIRAEILTLITKLQTTTAVSDELFATLDAETDREAIMDVLLKELTRAKEQKAFVICYILTRLFTKEELYKSLREFIKHPKIRDYAKMIALNLLKDLGDDIQYDEVNGYFTEFGQMVEDETKELLESAIMNPEAQIDFMDFFVAIPQEDQKFMLKSLNEDYSHDALANILIPVFLYNPRSEIAQEAINLLGTSKSQLAFHALEDAKEYVSEDLYPIINKGLSTLKLAGVRVDNTIEFYKEILKASKPHKSYISYPDGHGNNAIVFTRIRPNKTLQFVALVVNDVYGILDCFGFNEITEYDYDRILDKFFGSSTKVEVSERILKYMIDKAEKISRYNMDVLPYEYVAWKNIFLDIEPLEPKCSLESKELTSNEVESIALSEQAQLWFYDVETSESFLKFIKLLTSHLIRNNFNMDIDSFINTNKGMILTSEEINIWNLRFELCAYLSEILTKTDEAQLFKSLQNNMEFLNNIIRKSIYEYYVRQRFLLTNTQKTKNIFKKEQSNDIELELIQLDMIISLIEKLWVKA